MQHDAQRLGDTAAWIRRAELDLRAAEVDLATDPSLLGDAAFHCQQAAEKALKGFLTWHDAPFRRTHDLAEIGQASNVSRSTGRSRRPADAPSA
jgi:HEPN domain-containing protein